MPPFASNPADRVDTLGENALLARLRAWLGDAAPPSPAGMGDDTAVIPGTPHNLLTTDSLVRGIHFEDTLDPGLAGAKLLKRNLSDIAAMGGLPTCAVMAGFLPRSTSLQWLEGFTRGLAACALEHRVLLVGGDLTQTTDFLGFNLTLQGHAVRPVLRTGARIGDDLWVTGVLGGSIHGHHARFTPRLKEGVLLAQNLHLSAMIDVTDGLGKDLPALLPAGAAAALELEAIPLRDLDGRGPVELAAAFQGGADHVLGFAARPEWRRGHRFLAFEQVTGTPLPCIGTIVAAKGEARLLDASTHQPIDFGRGYVHFG